MGRLAPLVVLLALGAAGLAAWLLAGDAGQEERHAPDVPADEQAAPAVLPEVTGAEASAGAPVPIDVPPPEPMATPTGVPEIEVPGYDGPVRRVAGRVVRRSDGTPLTGVGLSVAMPPLDDGLGHVVSEIVDTRCSDDPPGAFVLDGVPTAEVLITMDLVMPGFRRTGTHALAAGAEDVADLELVLDSGFRLSVLVTDEAGRPIQGASVEAGDAPLAGTARDGRALVRDVQPDESEEAVRVTAGAPWRQRVSREVRAPEDPTAVPDLVLALPGSGVIEGVVSRRDGRGVPATAVRVGFEMTDEHGGVAPRRLSDLTDGQGRYRIDHVPAGRWVVQVGEAARRIHADEHPGQSVEWAFDIHTGDPTGGLDSLWIMDVAVRTDEVTPLDVVLPASASLRGRVTDPAGTPVPDAELDARSIMRWPAPSMNGSTVTLTNGIMIASEGNGAGAGTTVLRVPEQTGRTDAHGEYELSHLPPGEIVLSVRDVTGVLRPFELSRVLQPGESALLDVVLETGLHVRGTVVDERGLALQGATAYITDPTLPRGMVSHRAVTDADGRFDVGGLAPGTKRLQIDMDGRVTVWEEIEPGGHEGRWTLRPSPRMRGRVLDARTGEPLHDFDVSLVAENMSMSWSGQTYDEGVFEYDCAEDVLYSVTITAAGYREQIRKGVLPSSTALAPLVFRMDPDS